MRADRWRVARLKEWLHHAFAIEDPAIEPAPEERELVERLAELVVRRRMTTPALMLLESGRPLNFIGSQILAFLGPFAKMVFSPVEYDRFVELLEKRRSIDLLVDAITQRENREHE